MSKGNMLLGHARGKVGDLVFSRTNGQQVVRSRAAVVKNPQTEKQMIQRILMNTVAQAYSKFSPITDHSFEGIQTGQKSMSFFMSKNIDALRQVVAQANAETGSMYEAQAFSPLKSNVFAPNAYVIAKGTLPEIGVGFSGSLIATVDLKGTTYGDIISGLGLQRGDQLTLVATQGIRIERITFFYARIILDPTNENGEALPLDTPFIVDGKINAPSPRNEGDFNSLSISEQGVLSFNFAQQDVSSAAVIVSRQKADGTWLRSNSSMTVNSSAASIAFNTLGDCLSLLENGDIDTLSDMYLNNAGKGRLSAQGAVYVLKVKTSETFDEITEEKVLARSLSTMQVNGKDIPAVVLADGTKLPIYSTNRFNRSYGAYLTSTTVPANSDAKSCWEKALDDDTWIAITQTTPEGKEELMPEFCVAPTPKSGDWMDIDNWEGLASLGLDSRLFTNVI